MALDVSTTHTLTAGRRTRGKNLGLLTASTAMDNAENSITTVLFPLMREALGALGVGARRHRGGVQGGGHLRRGSVGVPRQTVLAPGRACDVLGLLGVCG